MRKLSQRHPILRKLSKRSKPDTEKLISEMKEQAKKDPAIVEKFEEYGVPLDEIDAVSVSFCPLDVSAKTKDEKIFLNEKMLADDSEVKDPTHYLVHELIHFLQQFTGKHKCKHMEEENEYLDLPTEEEAFKAQVDYKKREESEEDAEEYVERLLDHHDMEGKKRKEKKEELLDE